MYGLKDCHAGVSSAQNVDGPRERPSTQTPKKLSSAKLAFDWRSQAALTASRWRQSIQKAHGCGHLCEKTNTQETRNTRIPCRCDPVCQSFAGISAGRRDGARDFPRRIGIDPSVHPPACTVPAQKQAQYHSAPYKDGRPRPVCSSCRCAVGAATWRASLQIVTAHVQTPCVDMRP